MTTWMDVWAQKQSKDSYYNNNSSSSSNGKYNNIQYQLSVGSDADCADLYDDDAEADVVSQQRCSPTLVNAHRLTHTDTRTRTHKQTHTHTDRQWARIKFVRACKRECAVCMCVCVAYCPLYWCWCWLVCYFCIWQRLLLFSSETCFEPTTTVKCLPK